MIFTKRGHLLLSKRGHFLELVSKRVVKDVLPSKALICETMIFNQGDHDDAFNPHHQATVLV